MRRKIERHKEGIRTEIEKAISFLYSPIRDLVIRLDEPPEIVVEQSGFTHFTPGGLTVDEVKTCALLLLDVSRSPQSPQAEVMIDRYANLLHTVGHDIVEERRLARKAATADEVSKTVSTVVDDFGEIPHQL